MERRKATRYRLSAPVRVQWRTGEGSEHNVEHEANGATWDVSVTGILVECEGNCPPIHAEVHVLMTIQSNTGEFEIGGHAEVTRSYDSDQMHVFAADGKLEMIAAHH